MTTPARLIQWDVDHTLLVGGGVALEAFAAAFTAVTGVPWTGTLQAAGRTDLSVTPEELSAAGAHHVLDDLSDVDDVVALLASGNG